MAKLIFMLSLAVLSSVYSFGQSCCNAGSLSSCSGGAGLLTELQNNSAGLRTLYVPFETKATGEESYRDNFYMAELSVHYQFTQRLKATLRQPYRWNVRQISGETENLQGLADTRITAGYVVLNNASISKSWDVYWELGAGAKLPTGKYDQSIYYRDLPGNLNLGMGNLGYLFQSNLVFSRNKSGISLNAACQLNGKSRDDYRYGNQLTAGLSVFSELELGENWGLIPFGGLSFERMGKNHLPSGNFADGSGGEGMFAVAGIQARLAKWQLGTSFSRPIYQNYSAGEIVAKQRLSLELTYYF